jgi:uncharacterized protein YlzI (FlbEa/FlbD family)
MTLSNQAMGMNTLYGFEWEQVPAAWMFDPCSDKQLAELDKQRQWRLATPDSWHKVNSHIADHLGEVYVPDRPSKGMASMLLDFWVNADPCQKRSVEKEATGVLISIQMIESDTKLIQFEAIDGQPCFLNWRSIDGVDAGQNGFATISLRGGTRVLTKEAVAGVMEKVSLARAAFNADQLKERAS